MSLRFALGPCWDLLSWLHAAPVMATPLGMHLHHYHCGPVAVVTARVTRTLSFQH